MNLKNWKTAIAWIVLMVLVTIWGLAPRAPAESRVGLGYAALSDGTCPRTQQTVMASYDHESDDLEVRGKVRTEPAGGDCRLDTLSYEVFAARYFGVYDGAVDAMVKFGAAEQSTGAPYALADAGGVIPRPDGGALFSTNLPAGMAKNVIGVVGLSKAAGVWRGGGGFNFVPIDWSRHSPGRTLHLDLGVDWRGLDAHAQVDVGAASFGRAFGGYRRKLDHDRLDVGFGLTWMWGLDALDNGAPPVQRIRQAQFVRAGAPQGEALIFEISLGYRL